MLRRNIVRTGLLALCAFAAACSGTHIEEEPVLTLVPSRTSIVADGKEAVEFTVRKDAEDVTASAAVRCVAGEGEVTGNRFTTETPGTYRFEAVLGELVSEAVTVVATEPVAAGQFGRKVCVMEFTGAWCSECPGGFTYLNYLITSKYDGRVHMMAFHDNLQGSDPMGLPETNEIFNAFGLQGFPAYVTDLREGGLLNTAREKIRESFETSFADYPARYGVAVGSTVAGSRAEVTVRVFPEVSGGCRVALFVVEDGIKAEQNDSGTVRDYTHNHVVRRVVSATYKGDSMGELEAGKEAVKKYSVDIPDEWNIAKTHVYALVIDGDGYVNNMNLCGMDGGEADYVRAAE